MPTAKKPKSAAVAVKEAVATVRGKRVPVQNPGSKPKSNAKPLRFASEYVVDYVGSDAAKRAGYSEATARQIACNLLRRNDVQAEIARLEADVSAKSSWNAERVLRVLGEIATDEGNKAADRRAAAEAIGKHLGMFRDRIEHSGPDGAPIPLSLSVSFLGSDGDGNPEGDEEG